MISLLACITGFILDLIIGDPRWLYHPVRLIGGLITLLEKGLRGIVKKQGKAQQYAGLCMWIIVILVSTIVPMLLLYMAEGIHIGLRYGLESVMCYQLLATKSLKVESMKVYKALQQKDIKGARSAVSMIVGRDTHCLTEEGVTKATIETIAENTSDGIVAPLFYMMLGGAVLGFAYKAVNTMDSMVGYKNEVYIDYGRIPAKLDDIFNFLPARISAYFMLCVSYLIKFDWRNAYYIYQRDCYNHASPNAAQTESVCAGALRIQLAGDAYYFGQLYKKEYIGDALQPVVMEDIKRANQLLYGTAILSLMVFSILRYLMILL
ncbi:adenosylcobinamide-phosphate synthase CbiB [Lachnospiraceae bacterium LCP25S3_G4]